MPQAFRGVGLAINALVVFAVYAAGDADERAIQRHQGAFQIAAEPGKSDPLGTRI